MTISTTDVVFVRIGIQPKRNDRGCYDRYRDFLNEFGEFRIRHRIYPVMGQGESDRAEYYGVFKVEDAEKIKAWARERGAKLTGPPARFRK